LYPKIRLPNTVQKSVDPHGEGKRNKKKGMMQGKNEQKIPRICGLCSQI
jgi:hypothetical protein